MVLEDEFRKAKAAQIVYKGREIWIRHQFPVADGQCVRVTIESFDPDWGGLREKRVREGVGLMVDRKMIVAETSCRVLSIWPQLPPHEELRPPAETVRRVECGSMYEEAGIKNRLCLWLDEPFSPVEVVCHTRDGHIHVNNVWNDGNLWHGIHARRYGAGMVLEEIENGFRYHCNDGYPDEDFDDIVFRVERL